MKVNVNALYAVGGLAALAVVLYIVAQPRQAGRALGRAAAGTVTGVAAGVAEGVGSAIGVPLTDDEKCRACIAARLWLRASFYCPAGMWLAALADRASGTPPAPKRNVVLPDYVGDLPMDDAAGTPDGGYYGTPGA